MAHEIRVPSFGESITESTVANWLKNDGDWVEAGEPLVSIDTEKTSSDLEAPASGILRVKTAAGTDVPIGAVIGSVEPGEKPSAENAAMQSTDMSADEHPPDERGIEPETSAVSSAPLHVAAPSPQPGTAQSAEQVPEEVAQKAKSENKPPIAPGVQVPSAPIIQIPPKAAPVSVRKEASGDGETREPMSRMRRTIAQHLLRAKNETAMLTSFNEVDMSTVLELRRRHQELFQKKNQIKLGFMSFFVKAVVEALHEFPLVNASIDGDDIVYHHYYNIGVAVSTDRGLVVPVIQNADRKSFAEIEMEIASFAERARAGKLSLDELKGGTFTITNGGVFGSLLSTPLLNPPQVGILGMHTVAERPVAIDGKIEIRPMMYIALSYDHRLIDGRDAVQFLVRVRDFVSSPERILLGL